MAADLSDRALYHRGEQALYRAARTHFRGRRGELRRIVRRFLKPKRHDRSFLTGLTGSFTRALIVALLMLQLWAAPARAQPNFSSSSPTNATHTAAVGDNITATFSEAIAGGTVSASTFVVHGGFDGQHGEGGTASTHLDATLTGGGTTTLTFDPGADFAPGELVDVTLTTGLQNGSAQALSAARVFQFRAAAGTGPAVFSDVSHDAETPANKTRDASLGDLDGDGDLDLVTGNFVSQGNRVFLGDGDGTFATGSIIGSGNTNAVPLGDLDGDGDLDLVAANQGQTNDVYLGGGDGTFGSANAVDSPTNSTQGAVLGDLDGDGDLDLVIGNSGQANRVYLSDGDGTFAAGSDVDTPTNTTQDVGLGDVDGDGDLDLITGNLGQANRVYLSNGDGTFAAGSDVDTPANSTYDVSLGDVDGDGDLDFIAGDSSRNQVYLGNGDGTFASGIDAASTSSTTRSASLGDVDGDGDLDLVTGNQGGLGERLFLGNGDGSFGAGTVFTSASMIAMAVPLGDLDGDGDLDIVTANYNDVNRVYLNAQTPTFASSSPTSNDETAATSSNIDVTFSAAMSAATSSTFIAHGGLTGQLSGAYSGDGTTTLSFDPANDLQPNEVVHVTLTTGLESEHGDGLATPRVFQFRAAAGTGPAVFSDSFVEIDTPTNITRSITVGDVDGDGDLDVVAGNQDVNDRLNLNNGDGTFATGSDIGSAADAYDAQLADLDGDGDLDLLAGNFGGLDAVHLGDGTGSFGGATAVSGSSSSSFRAALGDLDGDGDLDMVTGELNQANEVFLGDGDGTFTSGGDIDTPTNNTFSIKLGDLDGDGDLDVVTGNNNQVNRVYLSNGDGTFATGNDVDSPTNVSFTTSLGDIDSDGDLDLLVGNYGQPNRVYLGDGDGTFATGSDTDTATDKTNAVQLADVDGDGDLDYVAGNKLQVNDVYLGAGDGSFAAGTVVDPDISDFIEYGMVVADMDGDGDLDIVTGNATQVNRVHWNADLPGFSSTSPTANSKAVATSSNIDATFDLSMNAATSSTFVAQGSMTGQLSGTYSGAGTTALSFDPASDLQPNEIVDVTLTTGLQSSDGDGLETARVFQFRAAAGTGPAVFSEFSHDVATETNSTRAVALGDLDGDGDPDLVTGIRDSENRVYLGTGDGSFTAGSDVDTPTNSTLAISLGDVDGDGDLDLVTGNSAQSNLVYLGAGDGSFAAGSDVGTPANNTWSIVLGDLDGDGDQDLVSGNSNQANRVYLGVGDGTFTGSDVDTPTNATRTLALGDVDADGDLDLLLGNEGSSQSVYLGDGDGTFTEGASFGPGNNSPRNLSLGDLDGDGDLDVVEGNFNQTNRVYLGDGAGDFSTSSIGAVNHSYGGTLGDVDGDGDLDFVAGNYLQANRLYLGDGTGSFPSVADLDTPTNNTWSVALGDLDGDGDLDLVTGNSGQADRVYLNSESPTLSSTSPTANAEAVATTSNIDATFDLSMNAATSSTFVAHGSLTGQLSGTYSGASSTTLSFDPTSDLQPNEVVEVTLTTGLQSSDGEALGTARVFQFQAAAGTGPAVFSNVSNDVDTPTNQTSDAALGDLDGDGDLDLITGNYTEVDRVYLSNGDGSFATGSDLETGVTDNTASLATGDLDGDGNLDLITGNYNELGQVYVGNGDGSFASGTDVEAGDTQKGESTNLGDLDGDGDLDLVFGNSVLVDRVHLGNGDGSFAAGSDIGTDTGTLSAALGDLDGDGDLDLVTGNQSKVNRVYLGNGDGSFATGSDVEAGITVSSAATSLGDLDGDGALDLVFGNFGAVNRAHLGNGDGTFAAGFEIDSGTSNFTRSAPLADVDGDGDLDVIFGNGNGGVDRVNRLYLGDGSGSFSTGGDLTTETQATYPIVLGDLDGDGDLDVVAGNYGQVNRVYLNSGDQGGTLTASATLDESGTIALVTSADTQAETVDVLDFTFTDSGGGDGLSLDVTQIVINTSGTGPFSQVTWLLNGDDVTDAAGTYSSGDNTITFSGLSISVADGANETYTLSGYYSDTSSLTSGDTFSFSIDGDVDVTTNALKSSMSGSNTAVTNAAAAQVQGLNADGTLTSSSALDESTAISLIDTVDTASEAVDLLDFTLTDGGGGDGLPLEVSQIVVNTSGTGPFAQVSWLLNGEDATDVAGTYSSGANTITFSGLSVSVADGTNETYTLSGYYNDTSSLTAGQTLSLSVDGDTDVTTSTTATTMSGSNAVISNAAAAQVAIHLNADGTLTSSSTLDESSAIGLRFGAQSASGAIDLLDFTLSDGGGGDGLSLDVTQVVVDVSGTGSPSAVTWLLDGPDADAVTGTAGASTITFDVSISVADGNSETYTVSGYFSNLGDAMEGETFLLAIDGDTGLTVESSGSGISGSNTTVSNSGTAVVIPTFGEYVSILLGLSMAAYAAWRMR